MHDTVDLESRGIPAVYVATEEFVDGAKAQARALGADPAAVFVAHPIQDRSDAELLGSGDKGLEYYYGNLPARYPGRIGSFIGYNDELAHWIEAGSDFFVMPSMFEPCGLNQMYSLRYGTLPIVRGTGGLEDTVQQYDERSGSGTGFKFWKPGADAIYYTVGWAVSTYFDRKHHMQKMIQAAMAEDFSWERSARHYLEAYKKAIANKRAIGE